MKNIAPQTSYRVTMSGRPAGQGSFAANESPTRREEAGHLRMADRHEPSSWMGVVSNWLAKLPRPVAAALTISGFLILINLFTNPHKIWFHWPVAAIFFGVLMRTALGHRPDSKEER